MDGDKTPGLFPLGENAGLTRKRCSSTCKCVQKRSVCQLCPRSSELSIKEPLLPRLTRPLPSHTQFSCLKPLPLSFSLWVLLKLPTGVYSGSLQAFCLHPPSLIPTLFPCTRAVDGCQLQIRVLVEFLCSSDHSSLVSPKIPWALARGQSAVIRHFPDVCRDPAKCNWAQCTCEYKYSIPMPFKSCFPL